MTTDDKLIECFDLSVRTYACIKRYGVKPLGDLRALKENDLARIRNISFAGIREIEDLLSEYPSQELVPVVHAKWEKAHTDPAGDFAVYRCSRCGRTIVSGPGEANINESGFPYCHCGAKMTNGGSNE